MCPSAPEVQPSRTGCPAFHPPLPCLQQDDEINQQSQLIEKLKQQMLDQEEVMGRRARGERCVCISGGTKRTFLQSDERRGILLGFSHPQTVGVWGLNRGFA